MFQSLNTIYIYRRLELIGLNVATVIFRPETASVHQVSCMILFKLQHMTLCAYTECPFPEGISVLVPLEVTSLSIGQCKNGSTIQRLQCVYIDVAI